MTDEERREASRLSKIECSRHDPDVEAWDDRTAFVAGYKAACEAKRQEYGPLVSACDGYYGLIKGQRAADFDAICNALISLRRKGLPRIEYVTKSCADAERARSAKLVAAMQRAVEVASDVEDVLAVVTLRRALAEYEAGND